MKEDGILTVRFEGVSGSPVVSGICIRRAPPGVAGTHSVPFYLIILIMNIVVFMPPSKA